MTLGGLGAFVIAPTLLFASYFVSLTFFPGFTRAYLHTEQGAVELVTALAFVVAAVLGGLLLRQTRHTVPQQYRVFYALFTFAGLFVALEEVSYGQKLFDWESPAWFASNNSKQETNLHNFFDNKPSNRLRSLATVGCPACCILLPLAFYRRRRGLVEGTLPYYLLPRLELVVMASLTIVLSVFNKIPSVKGMANWSGHLGELKEMYWGIVAACYAGILCRRLWPPRQLNDSQSTSQTPITLRRNAA